MASTQAKTAVLPEGDGKAIAEKSCGSCHPLTWVTRTSKSMDDWRESVQTMIDRGADISDDKVDILVKYLAENFVPKTNAPAGGGTSTSPAQPQSPDLLPPNADPNNI